MNNIMVYSDDVKRMTTEIKVIQDNVCQGMIEIGKRLIKIKKELGHGQWLPYLKNELNYSERTAQRLIRVATEFSNTTSMSDLQSTKIIALLDMPQEYRDDFISNHNVEDSTVRELKKEIQKYKEENGLLTEKQKKTLEEKKRIEAEKQELQQELQREKCKPARIEYKDRVVDNTDYTAVERANKLEEKNKQLEDSRRVYENAMNAYKAEVEEYNNLRTNLFRMNCIKGGDYDELKALDDINNLYVNIDKFIKMELSPVKYSDCIKFINNSTNVTDSFVNMINTVQRWCDEMREELKQNNNIINVEVN